MTVIISLLREVIKRILKANNIKKRDSLRVKSKAKYPRINMWNPSEWRVLFIYGVENMEV